MCKVGVSSYYSMLWSHSFSYSPNAALCSLQPFEEGSVHSGIRLHHGSCCHLCNHDTNQHFRWLVIDCSFGEIDCNCLKPTINPAKRPMLLLSLPLSTYMFPFWGRHFTSCYCFLLLCVPLFSALDVTIHRLELDVSESFL